MVYNLKDYKRPSIFKWTKIIDILRTAKLYFSEVDNMLVSSTKWSLLHLVAFTKLDTSGQLIMRDGELTVC